MPRTPSSTRPTRKRSFLGIFNILLNITVIILFAPLIQIALVGLFYEWNPEVISTHLSNVLLAEINALANDDMLLDLITLFESWRNNYSSMMYGFLEGASLWAAAPFSPVEIMTLLFYSWSIALLRGFAIAYSLILFLFMITAAAISGWIRWYERRTGAEPESGYLYHWLRTKVIFISTFAIALYILPPWYTSILWTIVPALVGAAILVRYQVAFFKKHL